MPGMTLQSPLGLFGQYKLYHFGEAIWLQNFLALQRDMNTSESWQALSGHLKSPHYHKALGVPVQAAPCQAETPCQ